MQVGGLRFRGADYQGPCSRGSAPPRPVPTSLRLGCPSLVQADLGNPPPLPPPPGSFLPPPSASPRGRRLSCWLPLQPRTGCEPGRCGSTTRGLRVLPKSPPLCLKPGDNGTNSRLHITEPRGCEEASRAGVCPSVWAPTSPKQNPGTAREGKKKKP